MLFLTSLVVDGALAGAIYALMALAFVVVYKASRMINFALGEWAMLGSRLMAAGLHAGGLGLAGAVGVACVGMVGLALAFSRVVLRRLVGRPPIAVVMVTLGLGALMSGSGGLLFRGVPGSIPLPIPTEPLVVGGVLVSPEKAAAATIAAACIAGLTWFFQRSRTGVALRAVAGDPTVAMSVGIDVHRHFAIAWGLMGAISLLGGVLWTFVTGGGFGVVLMGLKVFPIVIIGGLDSIPGTIVGAVVVGVVESVAVGYVDPWVGGGFGNVASWLLLIAVLFVRPTGLFGRRAVERV